MSASTDRPASRRLTRIAMIVLSVAVVLNSISSVVALQNNADRIHQIQDERVESVLRSCRDQNRRHDATVRSLDRLIRSAPPSRRRRAVQSRAGTVLLINALAPKRDCAAVARASVPSR